MEASSLSQYPWYFGSIDREEAESNLQERGENEGCFLVRESQSRKGHWTISVLDWTNGHCSVSHYLIKRDEDGRYYFSQDLHFDSIPDLINFYKNNTVDLTFVLRQPCPKAFRCPDKEDEYDLYEVPTELPKDESFVKDNHISTGVLCEVWRGHLTSNPRLHVVAKIAVDHADAVHALSQEASILKFLTHENVIRFRGVLSASRPFHLISECAGEQNLLEFLLTVDKTKISLSERLDIMLQIASGLKYCEKMRCIHRNIKAKSVIINSEDLKCRVGCFKHARTADEYGYFHSASEDEKYGVLHDNRLRWMAPEGVRHGRFSFASDAWSFAVLLVEIFSNGGLPYPGYLTCNILGELEKGYRNGKPATCPEEIYHLMRKCWMMSEKDRPNVNSIKETLDKYRKDNHEALVKLAPLKSRHISRYVQLQSSIKQSRTSTRKPAALHQLPQAPPQPVTKQHNYSYDN